MGGIGGWRVEVGIGGWRAVCEELSAEGGGLRAWGEEMRRFVCVEGCGGWLWDHGCGSRNEKGEMRDKKRGMSAIL